MALHDRRRWTPYYERWQVGQDGTGTWVLRDEDGNDPLKHPDPIRRLENQHLAAQAPELRAVALMLALYLDEHHDDGYGFTRKLVAFALGAVAESKAPYSETLQIERKAGQGEIDWEAA